MFKKDLISFITTIEQFTSFKESLDSKFANLAKNKMVKLSLILETLKDLIIYKIKTQKENESIKEFTNRILYSLSGAGSSLNEVSCHVKIENGAHSLLGKLVTRMWLKKRRKMAVKNQKSSNKKYQEIDENDNEDENEADVEKLKTKIRPEKPYKREYILRSSVSRPAPFSRQSPQRMYVLLSRDEFRIAGAFTEDTMFF